MQEATSSRTSVFHSRSWGSKIGNEFIDVCSDLALQPLPYFYLIFFSILKWKLRMSKIFSFLVFTPDFCAIYIKKPNLHCVHLTLNVKRWTSRFFFSFGEEKLEFLVVLVECWNGHLYTQECITRVCTSSCKVNRLRWAGISEEWGWSCVEHDNKRWGQYRIFLRMGDCFLTTNVQRILLKSKSIFFAALIRPLASTFWFLKLHRHSALVFYFHW